MNTACPTCGGPARRETDVSDNFLDSGWYFLRYPSSNCEDRPFDPGLTAKWLPVDMYVGGAEHSVLHLFYSRFITMALHDLGHVPFEEPFVRFRANGMLAKNGTKMSKSRDNVVNPDAYFDRLGADTLRMYLVFLGPYERGGEFSDSGIHAVQSEDQPTSQSLCRALERILTRDEVIRIISELSERGVIDCYPGDSEAGPVIKLTARGDTKPRANPTVDVAGGPTPDR